MKKYYLINRALLLSSLFFAVIFVLLLMMAFRELSYHENRILISICMLCIILAFFSLHFLVWKRQKKIDNLVMHFLRGFLNDDLKKKRHVFSGKAEENMYKKLCELLHPSKLFELNKRQAQYMALQNQINPHFLYNTLESIRSEALMEGLHIVADMTEALSSFFRYTISNVENLVTIEDEIENCETYFRIQQYRFEDRLSLEVNCNPDDYDKILKLKIPKLTLQPILENSIIHGTELLLKKGIISITLEITETRLLIQISDNGIGMNEKQLAQLNNKIERSLEASSSQGEKKGGLALTNVNNRIRLLFGDEYGIHVFSLEGSGTDVEISLPIVRHDTDIKNKEALL